MRLIDADWLEEHQILYAFNTRDDIREFINNAPTVEAEPIRHGKWICEGHDDFNNYYRCSCCEKLFGDNSRKHDPYCSHCGAKMDRE